MTAYCMKPKHKRQPLEHFPCMPAPTVPVLIIFEDVTAAVDAQQLKEIGHIQVQER